MSPLNKTKKFKKKSNTFFQQKNCVCASGKKKHWVWTKPMCMVHMDIFANPILIFSPPSFLHILGRKLFDRPGRKHLALTISFSSPLLNQIPPKKFSLLILSLSLSLKFTLPKIPQSLEILSRSNDCI